MRRSINSRIARDGLLMGSGVRARIETRTMLDAPDTAESVSAGDQRPIAPNVAPNATQDATGRRWRLWFPARLGPPRKREKVVNGVKVTAKGRILELPPTKNNHAKDPHSHAAWVEDWRKEAKRVTEEAGIPPLGRIRISAVVYRTRIGIADAENDHSRLAPIQDGIVDAKVIPKDTYAYCLRGSVTEARAGAAGPGILLIVDEEV